MTERLPGVLAEIAGLVGQGKALQLAAAAGGTRVYFPARAGNDHWLVQAVGREAADKICDHFAVEGRRGQRVDIPIFAGSYNKLVRAIAASVQNLDGEASSAEIARRTGITQRTVHRHRSRRRQAEKPGKQGKLL